MNRCDKLRWKGLFIEAEWDPTVQHCNDRAFWCQHTYNCLGPDGKLVDEFECSPARKLLRTTVGRALRVLPRSRQASNLPIRYN